MSITSIVGWFRAGWLRKMVGREDAKQPTLARDGYALPGFRVGMVIHAIPKEDHDVLGRLVCEERNAWAREQPSPDPSDLVPWKDLGKAERELDRRVGVRLANAGRTRYVEV